MCDARGFDEVLDLGRTPLANAFLTREGVSGPEPRFPLEVVRCTACGLVQLRHIVDRSRLFRHYVYFSSASAPMTAHFRALALMAHERFGGKTRGLAVEIGSNDGTLLRNLVGTNLDVLGVEPARNIASVANETGVPTWNEFFDARIARRIRRETGEARLVFSNNVVAHIDDIHDVARGVAELLEPDGVWLIEVPHLAPMVERVEFDTIYHEHLSYFSLPPMQAWLAEHDLRVVRVEQVPVHGGSLRLFVRHASPRHKADATIQAVQRVERRAGLDRASTYRRFRAQAQGVRKRLPMLLRKLRRQNARIVGYGAPAKGNTLLNACGIDGTLLEYLSDTTPAKQGLFAPGSRIPVRPVEAFHADPPDYALLLAWNFEKDILAKERSFLERGGRFIRPIPIPRIVGPTKR